MVLGIPDHCGGRVEAHGLVVEQCGEEFRRPVHLQVGAGVGQQGEADGVRFGESVEREGTHGLGDGFDDVRSDTLARHGLAQLGRGQGHLLVGTVEAQGLAQVLGLVAAEVGHDHGDFQHLLLEERNSQSALEDGFEPRVEVGHRFEAAAAAQIGMGQIALNGAGSDDGHLDDQVVEASGLHARQRGHLGAALDLEDPDGVGPLHERVGVGVVFGKLRQIYRTSALGGQGDGVLQHGHHAQAQEIDLDDAQALAVVLVPLGHDAAGHGRVFEWHDSGEFALAQDHAAGVLTQVSGQSAHAAAKSGKGGGPGVLGRQAGLAHLLFEFEGVRKIATGLQARETVQHIGRQVEDLADFAGGAAATVGDDRARHGGAVSAVASVDFLDDPFAAFTARQVDVDVGPALAAF